MTNARIQLHHGDITRLDVDAVVTAANSQLRGGGGVDGAVHRSAGPELLAECRTLGGCPAGEARLTAGYRLKARNVIHAVGPIWDGGGYGEPETLRSSYVASLRLAVDHGIESIAFPCISTGVYGFPKDLACEIAVQTVTEFLELSPLPRLVIFCCFEQEDYDLYAARGLRTDF